MANNSHIQVMIGFIGWLLSMAFFGMIWVWGWVIWRLLTGRRILPAQPLVSDVQPRWGVGTVLLVLLLSEVLGALTQSGYLWTTRRSPEKRSAAPHPGSVTVADPNPKPEAEKSEIHPDVNPAKPPKAGADKPAVVGEPFMETEVMFFISVRNGLLLILIPLLARLTSGARLRDMGICINGWMQQAFVGTCATLFVAPIVYLVQLGVLQIWPPDPSTDHPLKKMLEDQFSPGVIYLAFVSAVILAPMTEELMFRAIFQGWLSALLSRHNPRLRRLLKPPVSPQARSDDETDADHWKVDTHTEANDEELAPSSSRPGVDRTNRFSWPSIILTSVFFATLHLPQWPAPIAIFVLSMVLGTVYQRTGSLIAACFMHATFNGLSTIAAIGGLLTSQAAMEPNEKALALKTTISRAYPVALGGHWVIGAKGRR